MENKIKQLIPAECPWRDTLLWYDRIDSTNAKAKELACSGAAHGTCILAGSQSAGRGRIGRSFSSPEGMGVYLSLILRPNCPPEQLMHLTCAVAVAMCKAVEQAAGIRPGIKWINDLVIGKRKLGGILTELSIQNGMVDYAIVGIGINCRQLEPDFPRELQSIATSLRLAAGKEIDIHVMAAAMIRQLWQLELFTGKEALMNAYKENCITLGQDVQLLQAGQIRYGKATDLDENGCLVVDFPDGSRETIGSGEASIRGMYGYV